MKTKYNTCVAIVLIIMSEAMADNIHFPPACEIYCRGKLLDIVQKSMVYSDSKTFVDMKMRSTQEEIIEKFELLLNDTKGKPSKFMIRKFIKEYFSAPGTELERCEPADWNDQPKFINEIQDDRLRKWAVDLNFLWKLLCRKVKKDVRDNANLYSVVYVPNPVIIPGGRFREYYYWDSYWIILGLLRSEMFQTAKGMLVNLLLLVDKYGYVPNGGRIYYLQRSQPPMLIPMVNLYYNFTKDKEFIADNIDILEREFNFWMNNRCTNVTFANETYHLARYSVQSGSGPRPEAYMTDINTAAFLSSDQEKESLFYEIKSAAESGWDFSTRWYVKNGSRKGKFTDTKTTSIIPVDLNAILCGNANILSKFYELIDKGEKQLKYRHIYNSWIQAVTDIFWSEDDGIWHDYDKVFQKKRMYFYVSNLTPLWTDCYNKSNTYPIALDVVKYLNSLNITGYVGGVPTSLVKSGQHWDFPCAFPPLQYIIIIGLLNTGVHEAMELASKLATTWIASNFRGYTLKKSMFDHYDARTAGKQPGNIDFDTQIGFGWTNGVCIELLHLYGNNLSSEDIGAGNYNMASLVIPGTMIGILLCVH